MEPAKDFELFLVGQQGTKVGPFAGQSVQHADAQARHLQPFRPLSPARSKQMIERALHCTRTAEVGWTIVLREELLELLIAFSAAGNRYVLHSPISPCRLWIGIFYRTARTFLQTPHAHHRDEISLFFC